MFKRWEVVFSDGQMIRVSTKTAEDARLVMATQAEKLGVTISDVRPCTACGPAGGQIKRPAFVRI